MLPNTNVLRVEHLDTLDDFEDVVASPLDLAHPYNQSDHGGVKSFSRWAVFTSTLRHPTVSGIVSLPQDIAALCTKHCVCWPTEGLRDRARRGFRDFLQGVGSGDSDALIVTALRPCLHNTGQSPQCETTIAVAETDAHSNASSGDAPLLDVVRGQSRSPEEVVADFRKLRFHLTSILADATDDDNRRSMLQNIEQLEASFVAYSLARAKDLQRLLHEDATTQADFLTSEYNQITEFLLPAVKPWDVTRKRVRRWVRSCVGATLHRLDGGQAIAGIFTPEVQASILYATAEHEICQTDESLAALRAQLPQSLLEPLHWRYKDPSKPANNEAKRKRKKILEKIKDARQTVSWSNVCHEWEPVFVTRAELHEKLGGSAASEMWQSWCFQLEVKESSDFRKPCTKAEAFAAWANRGYSWASCRRYWDQLEPSMLEPRQIDDTSRSRIKARLQELVC